MDARTNDRSLAVRKRTAKSVVPDPALLLAWYDRHARALPWRTKPGAKPDPYKVWLSEIMLQQTRVETVASYYTAFLKRFPNVRELARARMREVMKQWAGLGYYARARNLHVCARVVVAEHRGRFPDTEEGLRRLPGIGAYTAAAIAAIAFNRRVTPVDGNVERVMARLYAVEAPLPAARAELARLATALTPAERPGDFAQALMDLGATVCSPKRPFCLLCPWNSACAALRRGDPESFPRRTPKPEGILRRGAAFLVRRADGKLLLRTRPAKGLLGGMSEVPTTDWTENFEEKNALKAAPCFSRARWRRLPGSVRHVFTHFPLELAVYVAEVKKSVRAPKKARWVAVSGLKSEALPSLMRKVIAHAELELGRKSKKSFSPPPSRRG
jgi:A/G-specific adenine glycosylase